jgi:type I restriction enzyme S subunit
VKKLGFLASLKSGDSITTEDIGDDGPYAVYGGNGLRGYTNRFTHEGEYALIGRQGALCGNINYAKGQFWASEHAVVVTPREAVAVRWLGELLRAMDLNQYSASAAQPGLAVETIAALKVPIPPLEKQHAIADYLDRETARLDALVAAKERVLGLLAEKRRALITRAVTRGLDPRAPLRDSGIPWLAKIPAHWQTKRAKWLFSERDQRSVTGEEVLLSLRMERGLVPHNDVSNKPTRPEELVGYKRASPGEIVVNRMRAAIGLVALCREDGLVSPDYAVFVPSKNTSGQYYVQLFTTELLGAVFRSVSTGMGTGSSGFLRLYSEAFLALWLPYPPLDEQSAISEFVGRESGRLDEMRAATERTLALLKERRSALIAAAVTGQIDVENVA